MKRLIFFLIPLLIAVLFAQVAAQKIRLSLSDKKRFVSAVLRKANPLQSDYSTPDGIHKVYLAKGCISPRYLPRLNNTRFIFISAEEINKTRVTENGVAYYSFGKFERRNARVYLSLSFYNISPRSGSGNTTVYSGRKIGKKWTIKSLVDSVWVSEGD